MLYLFYKVKNIKQIFNFQVPVPLRRPPSHSGRASGPVSDQSPLSLNLRTGNGERNLCFLPSPFLTAISFFNCTLA